MESCCRWILKRFYSYIPVFNPFLCFLAASAVADRFRVLEQYSVLGW
jgi:hypothetical protein